MNQKSAFQVENPLSAKKFWKKFISGSVGGCFIAGAFAFALFLILMMVETYNDGFENLFLLGFVAFFAIAILVLAIQAFYIQLYIKYYYYDCGDDFITIKKGVITPKEIHVQYQKIQDVYVDQDILDRIMGIYDVHIASATVTSGIEAHIDGVDGDVAENIKNYLLKKMKGGSRKQVNEMAPKSKKSSKVKLKEEVSSNTYPINGSWIITQFFSVGCSTLLIVFFLALWFGFRASDSDFDGTWSLIVFLLSVGLYFVIFVVRIIGVFIWKSNYFFELTEDFILLRTGIFSRQQNHMPYSSIQDVSISQGIAERLFGLASLKITNASSQVVSKGRYSTTTVPGGVALVGLTLAQAEKINGVLKEIVKKQNPGAMGL